MKSEHRHELRTNELAEWLSNLPGWTKTNLRMIIYVSAVIVLIVGSYLFHRYQKDVVAVQKQQGLTDLIVGLSRSRKEILRSQETGFDNSYMLLQTADDLQAAASNTKNDQMAALALIKGAEVLRMELHYRLGQVSRQDAENAIAQAKTSYTKALAKASDNRSLMAMAKFGLGLCEEELGNFTGAEQIYREIAANPGFEGTTVVVQAKERLETMDDYQQRVVFRQAPPPPAEPEKPQIQLDIPQVPDAILQTQTPNSAGQGLLPSQ